MAARRAALRLSGTGAEQLWVAAGLREGTRAPAASVTETHSRPPSDARLPGGDAASSAESCCPARAGQQLSWTRSGPEAASAPPYLSIAGAGTWHGGIRRVSLLAGAGGHVEYPQTPLSISGPNSVQMLCLENAWRGSRGMSGNAAASGGEGSGGLSEVEYHQRAEATLHHLHEELDVSFCSWPCA